ncbi:MAG: NADH-quinone oxidoreductase subunit H [Magnetococcales bacterium]|nr:NADH-quinone oxidoreductase subunit H [Magnetococcales bacterium]
MNDLFLLQLLHLVLALLLAPLLTGWVRKVKARLAGRQGPPLLQPYADLTRLLRKETVLAHNASWIHRSAPYAVFGATLLVCALLPTVATHTLLRPTADLIAVIGVLACGRFALALAAMDVGTPLGGMGASREMMIASLAEPAALMVIFNLSLAAGATSLPVIAETVLAGRVGLMVSLFLALTALILVALAETGRLPVDHPGASSELSMIHEAMTLEYSGRHLALVEAAAMLKLLFFLSLIGCLFIPWGAAVAPQPEAAALLRGTALHVGKLLAGGALLALFETALAKMRFYRVSELMAAALLLGLMGALFFFLAETW